MDSPQRLGITRISAFKGEREREKVTSLLLICIVHSRSVTRSSASIWRLANRTRWRLANAQIRNSGTPKVKGVPGRIFSHEGGMVCFPDVLLSHASSQRMKLPAFFKPPIRRPFCRCRGKNIVLIFRQLTV